MTASAKMLTLAQLVTLRQRAREAGRTVVMCHGCFDIVHPGHIRHLRFAKAQGDILLVSITGDAQVGKGAGRPLIPQELRAENLAELDCVDWVYIEPGPTAGALLGELQPDVYIKGREYEFNRDPRFEAERATVEAAGGRVVFSSGDVVFSSTALIAAMEQSVDPFHKRIAQLTKLDELRPGVLNDLVAGFRGRTVVVVGEAIIDTYISCDQPVIAGESPVMTLRPINRHQYDGGAAILARHAAAMGARAVLVTALPESDEAERLRLRLAGEGVEVRAIRVETPLPEKQRYLVGSQKVIKIDQVQPIVLDAQQQDRFVGLAAEAAGDGADVGIIADFGLGLITASLATNLCRRLRPKVGVLAGDVSGRRASLRAMHGLDLVAPSERELRDAMHLYDEGLPAVAWQLIDEIKAKAALVTLGADGLVAFDHLADEAGEASGWTRRLHSEHIPALCPIAVDALGCGDALLMAATLALAGGGSLLAGAFLGSVAAACQAQRLGNLPVSASDLRQGVARVHGAQLAFVTAEVIGSRPESMVRAS